MIPRYSGNGPSPLRQLVRRALTSALPTPLFITRGPSRSRSLCLTFDDGPHPETTPRVLDVLAREQTRATFFVVGREAERYPEIVKRMEGEGHAVGHHSYSHPNPMAVPGLAMVQDARRSNQVLRAVLGHPVRFYRPPHGKLRPLDFLAGWAQRQALVLWNVDPKDFAQPSAEHIVEWFAARPLRGGDLILMHDVAAHTAAALPSIIAGARRSGLQFERIEAWTSWSRPLKS